MTDELLNPDKLLFVRKDLKPDDRHGLGRLLFGAGDLDLRLANISLLLPLLHQACQKDPKIFWTKLFVPWISIQQSVRGHRDRILDEFVRIGDFGADSQELLIHLVSVYRSLVADLFDPYMTLVVASFQLIEGEFADIIDANVGLGERNKAEFLASRIGKIDPGKRLLSGYDPIVRNAITHSGSSGIVYHSDGVLFRNIRRGTPAQVETAEWSRNALVNRIVRLYECIVSTDAAVNVFGIDCSALLLNDEDAKSEFVQRLTTPERRAELRLPFERFIRRIRDDKNLTVQKRFELFSQVLLYNCTHRNMQVCGISVSSERQTVMVEIPETPEDLSKDEALLDAVMNCGHYAILARSVFGTEFDHYLIRTIGMTGRIRLTTAFPGNLLGEYVEERAGLVDLLHEVDVWHDGRKIVLSVDFAAVSKAERENLDRTFPRKPRNNDNS